MAEPVILVFGRKGSGKSTFIKALTGCARKDDEWLDSIAPTDGVEITSVQRLGKGRRSVRLKEVGGSVIGLWPKYVDESVPLLMQFADLTDPASMPDVAADLFSIANSDLLADRSLALILTKADLPHRLSSERVCMLLALKELQEIFGSRLHVFEISNVRGSAVDDVVQYLADVVAATQIGKSGRFGVSPSTRQSSS